MEYTLKEDILFCVYIRHILYISYQIIRIDDSKKIEHIYIYKTYDRALKSVVSY